MLVNTIQSYLCIRTHTPIHYLYFLLYSDTLHRNLYSDTFSPKLYTLISVSGFYDGLKRTSVTRFLSTPPPRVHKGYMFKDDFFLADTYQGETFRPFFETIKNVNPIPCQTFKYLLYTVTTVFIRLKILLIGMLPFWP